VDRARQVALAVGGQRRVAVTAEPAVHDEDVTQMRGEPGDIDKVGVHGRTS
jgi:hypothetical protein